MEWAMLASVLAPYLIQAFSGKSDSSTPQDPQALADTNAMRTALLSQVQNQNTRVNRREPLDAQIVSLMQSLMPTEASGLISPGANPNRVVGSNPSTPFHPPDNPTPGHVYKSEPTDTPDPSTNGDGSSQGTRTTLPSAPNSTGLVITPRSAGMTGGQNLPTYMFPGWLDSLPTYKQAAAKGRLIQ